MDVIGYQNIKEIELNLATPTWDNSSIPWVSSPKIDAKVSINNLPESWWSTDIVWWSTWIVWSATDYNTIAWASWDIKLWDWTTYAIDAWNTWNMTTITYIYADIATPSSTLLTTTTPQTAVWLWKLMVAVCKPVSDTAGKAIVQPFGTVWTDIFITADNIAANTITTNELAANSIDGMTITWALIRTDSSWERIQLNWTNNRLEFRDSNGDDAWYITWIDESTIWATIATSSNFYVWWTWMFNWKLRIPVWTNLY